MEELTADAYKLTDPAKHQYGFVANGQKGPAVAQDWMQYNTEMGGSILGPDGKPALDSDANVKSLTVYRDLFQKAASPARSITIGAAARRASVRALSRRCRPGRSGRLDITIRRARKSSTRWRSRRLQEAPGFRNFTASAAGAWRSMPASRTSRKRWHGRSQVARQPACA